MDGLAVGQDSARRERVMVDGFAERHAMGRGVFAPKGRPVERNHSWRKLHVLQPAATPDIRTGRHRSRRQERDIL